MKHLKKLIGLFFLVFAIVGCAKEEPAYIEVTAEDAVFENRFYYNQLTEDEQLTYREIYQGIINHAEEINVHGDDPDEVNAIMDSIMYDFAELFWVDGSAYSTTYEDSSYTEIYTVIEPTYIYSSEERATREEEIEKVASDVLQNISGELDEYGKIKYVYEYLVDSVEYVDEAPDNQNIYSSLVLKETVCAGYAKANQYLLNELGIFCTYVTGEASDEEGTDSHAWNIVKCNGNYYYVDVTWADPIVEEVDTPTSPIYDYLCCSSREIEDTHTLEEGYDYPECTAEDLEYYRLNQMFYDAINEDVLLSKMKDSINVKEAYVTFKFPPEIYEEARDIIINDLSGTAAEYLCDRYNLRQVQYFYEEDTTINRVTLYWLYE